MLSYSSCFRPAEGLTESESWEASVLEKDRSLFSLEFRTGARERIDDFERERDFESLETWSQDE